MILGHGEGTEFYAAEAEDFRVAGFTMPRADRNHDRLVIDTRARMIAAIDGSTLGKVNPKTGFPQASSGKAPEELASALDIMPDVDSALTAMKDFDCDDGACLATFELGPKTLDSKTLTAKVIGDSSAFIVSPNGELLWESEGIYNSVRRKESWFLTQTVRTDIAMVPDYILPRQQVIRDVYSGCKAIVASDGVTDNFSPRDLARLSRGQLPLDFSQEVHERIKKTLAEKPHFLKRVGRSVGVVSRFVALDDASLAVMEIK